MQEREKKTQLSDDQILQLGQHAGEALKNPIFMIEYNQLRAKYFKEFCSADPEHTKTMMWLKSKVTVLDEIYKDLIALVEHAEGVYARLQAENDPQLREKERLDQQGFDLNYGQGAAS